MRFNKWWSGTMMETFEKFYLEDVVMVEANGQVREGKALFGNSRSNGWKGSRRSTEEELTQLPPMKNPSLVGKESFKVIFSKPVTTRAIVFHIFCKSDTVVLTGQGSGFSCNI